MAPGGSLGLHTVMDRIYLRYCFQGVELAGRLKNEQYWFDKFKCFITIIYHTLANIGMGWIWNGHKEIHFKVDIVFSHFSQLWVILYIYIYIYIHISVCVCKSCRKRPRCLFKTALQSIRLKKVAVFREVEATILNNVIWPEAGRRIRDHW